MILPHDHPDRRWWCADPCCKWRGLYKDLVNLEYEPGRFVTVCPECQQEDVFVEVKCPKCGTLQDGTENGQDCPKCGHTMIDDDLSI